MTPPDCLANIVNDGLKYYTDRLLKPEQHRTISLLGSSPTSLHIEHLKTITCPEGSYYSTIHDIGILACGLTGGDLHLVQIDGSNIDHSNITKHSKAISKIAIDGTRIISVSLDGSVIVRDIKEQQNSKQLNLHHWPILSCAWLGSDRFATISEDATLKVYDLSSGHVENSLNIRAYDMVCYGDSEIYLALDGAVVKLAKTQGHGWITSTLINIDGIATSLYISKPDNFMTIDTPMATYVVDLRSNRILTRILTATTARREVMRSCLIGNLLLRGTAGINTMHNSFIILYTRWLRRYLEPMYW